MGFTVKKRVLRRVLRRGSEKGVSRRCLETPLGECDPLGVRPTQDTSKCGPNNLSGTTVASQNRSDHGGRKQARNHSTAEMARFFASRSLRNDNKFSRL